MKIVIIGYPKTKNPALGRVCIGVSNLQLNPATMSSKKLTQSADLNAYSAKKAYIRIFKYSPLNQFDHLICVHGDRGQGTSGEVEVVGLGEKELGLR